jgi:Flp pilus assembly protein TadG
MKMPAGKPMRAPSLTILARLFAAEGKAIWSDQRGVAAVEFGLFALDELFPSLSGNRY